MRTYQKIEGCLFVVFLLPWMCNSLFSQTWEASFNKLMEIPNHTYNGDDKYKGETDDGVRDGLGIYSWNDGSYYLGVWSKGEREGMGIYLAGPGLIVSNCAGCKVYVGHFEDGGKSGNGTCYDLSGNLIFYGEFYNGKPSGVYPTSGRYNSYKFQTITYSGGDRYIGETVSGQREGIGIYVWSKGTAWLGSWKGGSRLGRGIYLYHDDSWVVQNCSGDNCTELYSSSSSNSIPAASLFFSNWNYYSGGNNSSSINICPSCKGTGVCGICKGSGIYSSYGYTNTCTQCSAANGRKCSVCNGTGRIGN